MNATVDSTQIKIGEQLNYYISVETDSSDLVVFPENSFSPLEVVESHKTDTTRVQDRFRLLKEYALTQFDSGKYVIPQQKVLVNSRQFLTDSIPVEVATVAVDTTKQKMYPIKASVDIPDRFTIPGWIWWLLGALVLIAVVFFFFRRKKKKEEAAKELPPYEEAITALNSLDNSPLLERREIKEYYSRLTDSVRRYLDREVYDRALESTTAELIAFLEASRSNGKIRLDENTIQDLQLVLQRADLAKFANSRPDVITAKGDRSKVEHVINDVKTSIPEPTEEELLRDEAYREAAAKKRKRKRILAWSIVGALVLVVVVGSLMATKGMTYLKDSFLGHPTKELLEGDWIRSEYGNPPVAVTTPEVLKRGEMANPEVKNTNLADSETFMYGSLISNFYTVVNTIKFQGKVNFKLDKAVDGIYNYLEQQGAKNIVMKQEDFTTLNGAKGIKVFGTLEVKSPVTNKLIKNKYVILNFAENNGYEQVIVIYSEGDDSAQEIAQRIIDSVELLNLNS
ncbi:MAG: DUF4381 domain-containing protein [Salegentibacter sp.]